MSIEYINRSGRYQPQRTSRTFFLAVQDSSKVDLVNQSVTHLLILTSSEHCRAVVDNVSFLPIYQKDEDKDKDKDKDKENDIESDQAI